MKYIFKLSFLLVSILFFNIAIGQIVTPVTWNFSTKKISDCEYELIFKAKIDAGWHMYGQKPYDDGPWPTSFKFKKGSGYELSGKTSESKLIKKFEPVFNAELEFFENSATFIQKIKLKSDKAFEIKGEVEYMLCNENQCLPPTVEEFSFKLQGSPECIKDTAENEEKETEAGRKWWNIFLIGFLGGLAALLTPCVFPMIPMTVSFFTKQSNNKAKGHSKPLIYRLFINVITVL